jgi:ribosomal protein L35
MFFIFDCNKDIVGNLNGYKTHKGAQAQCERTGKIRTAIFTAHHLKEWPKNGIKHLYSIRWVD